MSQLPGYRGRHYGAAQTHLLEGPLYASRPLQFHTARKGGGDMTVRKQFLGGMPADPELVALMAEKRKTAVTNEELRQQRISFAFGNALNAEGVTKDSVRTASGTLRLRG